MESLCSVEALIELLHTRVGVPLDTPDIETASWEQIGVESLGLTEICTSLEHQLGIDIPHEEALTTNNVQELVMFVNALHSVSA